MRIVFLDIDGVLNDNTFDAEAESSTLRPAAVERLREILRATGAKVVLTSSWRYLITAGAMTVEGFEYLLRTHGLPKGSLVGHTPCDEELPGRGAQIRRWLEAHGAVDAWVALDDDPLELGADSWRHVRTQRGVGLTAADVRQSIEVLGRSVDARPQE
jgi:HAD domain in Swiss Army Knife RNA repair proteins